MSKDKIEYSSSCPKCLTIMQEINKSDETGLFYYCKKCKQKYRIDCIHEKQIIRCPHCNKDIKLTPNTLSNLHMNAVLNFDIKKIKVRNEADKDGKH